MEGGGASAFSYEEESHIKEMWAGRDKTRIHELSRDFVSTAEMLLPVSPPAVQRGGLTQRPSPQRRRLRLQLGQVAGKEFTLKGRRRQEQILLWTPTSNKSRMDPSGDVQLISDRCR